MNPHLRLHSRKRLFGTLHRPHPRVQKLPPGLRGLAVRRFRRTSLEQQRTSAPPPDEAGERSPISLSGDSLDRDSFEVMRPVNCIDVSCSPKHGGGAIRLPGIRRCSVATETIEVRPKGETTAFQQKFREVRLSVPFANARLVSIQPQRPAKKRNKLGTGKGRKVFPNKLSELLFGKDPIDVTATEAGSSRERGWGKWRAARRGSALVTRCDLAGTASLIIS